MISICSAAPDAAALAEFIAVVEVSLEEGLAKALLLTEQRKVENLLKVKWNIK